MKKQDSKNDNPMTARVRKRRVPQIPEGTPRDKVRRDSRKEAIYIPPTKNVTINTDEIKRAVNDALMDVKTNDGWANALVGLAGVMDKRKATEYGSFHLLPDQELECIYFGDGIGARIVDLIADDMTREWITVKSQKEDDEENEAAQQDLETIEIELERLDAENKFNEALKWARLYGGSVIVIGALDGQPLNQPLNIVRIKDIDYLRVVDRSDIYLASSIFQMDATKPGFGQPIVLRMIFYVGTRTIYEDVHVSRCILFKGRRVPAGATLELNAWERFWGLSEIQMIYEKLKDWGGVSESIVNLIYEMVIGKYKIANLANMLATGNEKAVITRMEVINMAKSIIHGVLLGEGEEYTRDTVNLGGVGDVLDRYMMNLSAACGIPVTRLFGRSPGGMNATGESDVDTYYDMIKSKQKTKLKPGLRQFIGIICAWKKIKTPVEIEFNSLFQVSEEVKAKVRLVENQADLAEAQTFGVYMDKGVLVPEQVFALRWADEGIDFDAEGLPSVEDTEEEGQEPKVPEGVTSPSLESPVDTDVPNQPVPPTAEGRVGL